MEASSSNSSSKSGLVVANERRPSGGIRIENPFTLKVGQVFTGFGIGCGVGIGVGRPINLGAIPVLNQVMGATRGATDALSGVSRHVNNSLRKLGAKNIEAGIGCGVGIGHGFGVGLAVKPGVLHQIQFHLVQGITKMMVKFGVAPNLAIGQGALPSSLQRAIGIVNDPSSQNPMGSSMQLATKLPDHKSQGLPGYGNTEKVLSSFLQNPVLKGEESEPNEAAGRLRSENKMLQMILKHQQVIEELMEENEKLRHVLVEDLKIPPSKLQASYSKFKCLDQKNDIN
ncbi:uncharacterized protein Pyn_12283 [Prunus yedoensis var. nudiflora]|uniref:Uncharacterized protein n=1 Tax=Prunus yedoensis var. nudiflora TaxID=2094558 RepID=A0A314UTR4_PRUYE|nr:uncharacterized protein Pyn_12283 [Prunus yedoensis var. nudiflora]